MMDSSTISQIGQIYLTKKCVMNEIRGKLGMLSQTEMVIQNTLNCLCVRQRLGGSVDGWSLIITKTPLKPKNLRFRKKILSKNLVWESVSILKPWNLWLWCFLYLLFWVLPPLSFSAVELIKTKRATIIEIFSHFLLTKGFVFIIISIIIVLFNK
jgi:hypothetical protein